MTNKVPRFLIVSFLVWVAGKINRLRKNPFRDHEKKNPEASEYRLLLKVISAKDIDRVKELLGNSKDIVKPKSPWNDWPLSLACAGGDLEIVEVLLECGPNPNAGMLSKPLMEAAMANHVEIIRLLHRHGVNLEQSIEDDETALYEAVSLGNFEAAKCLVELGANVNFVSRGDGTPPLSVAKGNKAIYELLLPHTLDEYKW